jgi:hypothetical protein
MHDHKWRAAAYLRIINKDAVGIYEALFDLIIDRLLGNADRG